MYEDFLILMNASEYPRIKVSFSKQQLKKSLQHTTNVNCPDVRITIAGITRIYKIQCSMVKCADDLYLRGEEMIRLSDFKLKPPAKLLGLVKVNNEINVNFGFIITFTDNNQLSLAP
jgi:polyisoprenoid-binding protein YceI